MLEIGDKYLEVRNLTVYYGTYAAVKNVSFNVPKGKIVSLLGPNGSGKSTIMKAISGVIRPVSGEIWFQGTRIDKKPANEILKMGISHVLEGRRLFPYMTLLENLQMGAYSRIDVRKGEIERDLEEIYERFPVIKEKRNRQARTLSGGEAQMVAIARSLMSKPSFLLLDEPLQGLSPIVIEEVAEIITYLKQSGFTVLMIEHNISMAFDISEWVYLLFDGELVLQGQPQDLSETEYVQKFYLGV